MLAQQHLVALLQLVELLLALAPLLVAGQALLLQLLFARLALLPALSLGPALGQPGLALLRRGHLEIAFVQIGADLSLQRLQLLRQRASLLCALLLLAG